MLLQQLSIGDCVFVEVIEFLRNENMIWKFSQQLITHDWSKLVWISWVLLVWICDQLETSKMVLSLEQLHLCELLLILEPIVTEKHWCIKVNDLHQVRLALLCKFVTKTWCKISTTTDTIHSDSWGIDVEFIGILGDVVHSSICIKDWTRTFSSWRKSILAAEDCHVTIYRIWCCLTVVLLWSLQACTTTMKVDQCLSLLVFFAFDLVNMDIKLFLVVRAIVSRWELNNLDITLINKWFAKCIEVFEHWYHHFLNSWDVLFCHEAGITTIRVFICLCCLSFKVLPVFWVPFAFQLVVELWFEFSLVFHDVRQKFG